MEQQITSMIHYMAKSQEEMARIIEAKRHVAVRMAHLVCHIPDEHPDFAGVDGLSEHSLDVTKSITAYLNSLADLEEAITEQMSLVMKEMGDKESEE